MFDGESDAIDDMPIPVAVTRVGILKEFNEEMERLLPPDFNGLKQKSTSIFSDVDEAAEHTKHNIATMLIALEHFGEAKNVGKPQLHAYLAQIWPITRAEHTKDVKEYFEKQHTKLTAKVQEVYMKKYGRSFGESLVEELQTILREKLVEKEAICVQGLESDLKVQFKMVEDHINNEMFK